MKRHSQNGFGAIMAIVVLVILASLSAAMLRFGSVQQQTSVQDMQSARAWAAAKAGTEWGLYQALINAWCDGGAAAQPNLNLGTGFNVNVVCTSTQFNEGESSPGTARTVRVYTITATACNSAVSCPDPALATSVGYIERQRQVIATNE